jgi:alginate O-acetyltransferase complex protein AlgI
MLFTSPVFLCIFLPLFFAVYYLAPPATGAKNMVALTGSVFFFAWGEPLFVFGLVAGTYIDYRISRAIEPSAPRSDRSKRQIMAAGITLDVLALVASKYLDFLVGDVIDPVLHLELVRPNLPLLLGISFITFHRISFLVDSYKGRADPPRGFRDCALYIFLFPQLIAGPIIRYHDIGPQIHARQHVVGGFLTGMFRFSVGLAKKALIADPLGAVADHVFVMPPSNVPASFAWGGIVAYSLQIYFDFSGYSDMALGLGRTMGFRFPENFNRPYVSRSVTEFWRRWHISLSNWMRLYLYIPLGGNRGPIWRTYVNLWAVFLISGLWHGASWNFLAWGAYYGLFLCVEKMFHDKATDEFALWGIGRWLGTLLIVLIGWVFFRASDLRAAIGYLGSMAFLHENAKDFAPGWGVVFGRRELTTMAIGALLACAPVPWAARAWFKDLGGAWTEKMTMDSARAIAIQFAVTAVLIIVAFAAITTSGYTPFLYFRF